MSARRRAAWLLSVPLMFAGSQFAHAVAYRLVYPDPQLRQRDLAETGHSYMTYMPFVVAVCLAAALVSIAPLVAGAARNRHHAPVPPWAFTLLPILAFACQEAVERAFAGALDLSLLLEPTFRLGVLLQVPFAVVAFILAWLLLRVAERIGAGLRSTFTDSGRRSAKPNWFAVVAALLRRDQLADGHAGRGPPSLVLATA